MAETRRLRRLVESALERLDVPPGPVAVALSGGADSAVLALLMRHAGAEARAIHVDHGLPASAVLRAAAEGIAAVVGVGIEIVTVELEPGPSPEGRARSARYEALTSRLRPGEWLATGHTMDDQAETVTWALLRGAGSEGLAGMAPRQRPLARPMLSITRGETRELATLAGLPFADDPMNLDLGLTRNAIRLQLLAALESRYNPRLREVLARMATSLRSEGDLLDDLTRAIDIETDGTGVRLALGALRSAHPAVASRALRRATRLAHPPYAATGDELGRLTDVVFGRAASAQLPGGLTAYISGAHLVLEAGRPSEGPLPAALHAGSLRWGRFRFEVEAAPNAPRAFPIGTWQAVFAGESSLSVRPIRPDDPVPAPEPGWPLVEADGVPAWVPGLRRLPAAWWDPGMDGYLSVLAEEEAGWTSSP